MPMPVPSAMEQNTPSSNNQMISSQNDTELEEFSSEAGAAKNLGENCGRAQPPLKM